MFKSISMSLLSSIFWPVGLLSPATGVSHSHRHGHDWMLILIYFWLTPIKNKMRKVDKKKLRIFPGFSLCREVRVEDMGTTTMALLFLAGTRMQSRPFFRQKKNLNGVLPCACTRISHLLK
ncbi:unnamed protein product [Amoebophrya sp. A120]|nr:unnamed protein product [Amoebophrya sp. A120]|eukprot:GSA120T00001448001.1